MTDFSAKQDLFVPDGSSRDPAIERTTHLGIGAHQDDLEFMAFHGVAECFYSAEKWFGGIICTDGTGSVRSGHYSKVSPFELSQIRRREQRIAAEVGRYSFVAQLGCSSKSILEPLNSSLVPQLTALLCKMQPTILYTHNPADKHETHIRVLVAVLQAIREIPVANRPVRLLGCEMWRGLDWLLDDDKVVLDVSGQAHLSATLNGVFDSQIAGGKRYDLAIAGRRQANATFLNAHSGDALRSASYAIDLTPLIGNDPSDLLDFTLHYVDRLRQEIGQTIRRALVL